MHVHVTWGVRQTFQSLEDSFVDKTGRWKREGQRERESNRGEAGVSEMERERDKIDNQMSTLFSFLIPGTRKTSSKLVRVQEQHPLL